RAAGCLRRTLATAHEQTAEESARVCRADGEHHLARVTGARRTWRSLCLVECIPVAFVRSAKGYVEQSDADHSRAGDRYARARSVPESLPLRVCRRRGPAGEVTAGRLVCPGRMRAAYGERLGRDF